MTATKPTPEQLAELRAYAEGDALDVFGASALVLALLNAYEATLAAFPPAPSGSLRAVAEGVIAIDRDHQTYSSNREAARERIAWFAPALAAEVIRLEAKALAFDAIARLTAEFSGADFASVAADIGEIIQRVEDSPDGR